MSTENPYGTQSSSQTGSATGRSPEYDDGLTVQDTTHGAQPASASDTLAGQGSTAGSGRDLGDNRDGMGRDRTEDVTADESGTLISADKVVGTAVYDASGDRLGTIDSIMLNKRSGRVAYAVMSFGGFLGIGERYHPLPWNVLTYDENKGGYNVQHSADDLRKAPNYSRDEVDTFDGGSGRRNEVDSYYGVPMDRNQTGTGGDYTHGSGGSTLGRSGDATYDSRHAGATIDNPTGVEAADAIGSTTGAGSSGMGSTGMGANRNF